MYKDLRLEIFRANMKWRIALNALEELRVFETPL
jgi:hypothetical protein